MTVSSTPEFVEILSRVPLTARTKLVNYYHRGRLKLNMRLLGVRKQLPRLTDYSVRADFLNIMISTIFKQKPNLIVEAGCGVSTIIAAYCLKKLGRGSLISLEHQKEYLEPCQRSILHHELQAYVRVVHAPLTGFRIGEREWLWYETRFKEGLAKIDMLIVDGPPADVQEHSRYPMPPLLFDVLSEEALILMDDGVRSEEQEIAARWVQEYGCFDASYISSLKGLIRLKRR